MSILKCLSLKNEENLRTMILKQNLLGLIKKISFVYNKQQILQWTIAPTILKIF